MTKALVVQSGAQRAHQSTSLNWFSQEDIERALLAVREASRRANEQADTYALGFNDAIVCIALNFGIAMPDDTHNELSELAGLMVDPLYRGR